MLWTPADVDPNLQCIYIAIYSATKQESKTFLNHFLGLKVTQTSLLVTKMATTVIFTIFYKIVIFPYIANREAIYVQGSFYAFFTDFGQKWHFLRNGKE